MSKYKRYEKYKDSGVEWIGEIPEHWEIKKLKYICSESAVYGLNESAENYAEEGVRFIRTTDIDDKGNLDSNEEGVFLPEEKTKGYILKTGDLLVSRSGSLGTSLYFDENKYGKCSYAGYLVKFRANSKNHPKFLFYFSKSNIFYIQIQMALVSSTISNFNGNKYANMILTLSSYNEQKTIANFLDQKTTEIDDLIANKEKLIELLQEKRQAIITEAVTKGLNPNVKMKDSGIEWIGEIPEHWEVNKLKYVLKNGKEGIKIGPFGSSLKLEEMDENNPYKVYGQENIITNDFTKGSRFITQEKFNEMSGYQLFPGDIVISMMGTIGKCKVIPLGIQPGIMDSHLIRLRTNAEVMLPKFLEYLIDNANYVKEQMNFMSKGSIMSGLNSSIIKDIILIIPSVDEQNKIINFLDKITAEIDDLITEIKLQIQKLKEYRQSLIFEAVTGKIDVRDYVVD